MNDRELFEKWYEETYKVDEDARFKYRTSSVEEIAWEAWQHQQQRIDNLEKDLEQQVKETQRLRMTSYRQSIQI